jgi:hypothetical protein
MVKTLLGLFPERILLFSELKEINWPSHYFLKICPESGGQLGGYSHWWINFFRRFQANPLPPPQKKTSKTVKKLDAFFLKGFIFTTVFSHFLVTNKNCYFVVIKKWINSIVKMNPFKKKNIPTFLKDWRMRGYKK